jgi:hypothetical protein
MIMSPVGEQRRDHRALSRPLVTDRDNPVFQYARLQPLPYQADDAWVADPMLDEAHEPTLTNFVEKGSDVRVKNEVHSLGRDPDAKRIQRIVLATPWSEPVAEPEELLLVDAVQHGNGRPLDYLVFQGGHRQWALSSVSLRYVRPARRQCPIGSSVDPRVQISEV